ncbi:spindle pole body formation-associated protein-domain-containing protein [Microdochium trichocladiopsis]|uniref:Spindle pole body formation-associated protein-domain-containing protein n=1 Tax=Microdochium trichocladiopsis TaxID=1682393 RepID=A0A9P9BRX5_9PEZI|nr:spindle pole body formation-associated protein-domain-containing protein [Microdochium trichocladiopsis]KAH7033178.1 spindle pole body formation-associated protein-domain-containing protein [Microdochium trichocladiopsis]
MLGWAIKRSFQGATGTADAPPAEDTTQLEGPDTPAPVFAARAIKNAIFGASADEPADRETMASTAAQKTSTKPASNAEPKNEDTAASEFRSPTKLNSILLTPGTGTARRKRVSFGGDVKASTSAEPSPFEIKAGRRRNTALQQALENSRKNKKLAEQPPPETVADPSEELGADWEEEDFCNHDVTVDLNEPHSGSGKYWKSEFDRYHEDAKAEMTALVKYKHLAKSYAKQKDTESVQLARQLREEQEKVAALEKLLGTMSDPSADKSTRSDKERDQTALVKELSKQTSLVMEYRDRIRDLESTLKEKAGETDSGRRAAQTSPRDEKTLLEVNRELRRVKSELKQMDGLRAENERLKAALIAAKDQATRNSEAASSDGASDRAQARELGTQVRELKEELRKERSELRKVKREFETLKKDAKMRTVEAMQVLQEKNDKIAQLENEIRAAKKERESGRQQRDLDRALAEHQRITRDLESDMTARRRVTREKETAATRRPHRSLSAEDFTLDFTSQVGNLHNIRSQVKHDEQEHRTVKEDLATHRPTTNARGLGEKEVFEADDWTTSRPAQTRHDGRIRAVRSAQVLADLPNDAGSKGRTSIAHDAISDKYGQSSHYRPPAAADDNVFHRRGTYESLRAPKPDESSTRRHLAACDDEQGIDLLQNRFASLGNGISGEKPPIGNTSRCSLPPDRLAAARARLEQKKLDRMRPAAHRLQEVGKENYEP